MTTALIIVSKPLLGSGTGTLGGHAPPAGLVMLDANPEDTISLSKPRPVNGLQRAPKKKVRQTALGDRYVGQLGRGRYELVNWSAPSTKKKITMC